MSGKCASTLAKKAGVVITVSVDQWYPSTCEIESVLEFASRSIIVVVALCVHYADCWMESSPTGLVKPTKALTRIAESTIKLAA